MIAVATRLYDLDGSFVVHRRDALIEKDDLARRISKSATLDGGVFIFDGGLSHGDREFEISLANPTKAFVDQLKYLMEFHSDFTIAVDEGVFRGILEILDSGNRRVVLRISIEEKLT